MVDIFDFLGSISWAIVPSLGAISMRGLAREKQFDNYNSSSSNTYSQSHQSSFQTQVVNGQKTSKGVSVYTNSRLPYTIVDKMNNNNVVRQMIPKDTTLY